MVQAPPAPAVHYKDKRQRRKARLRNSGTREQQAEWSKIEQFHHGCASAPTLRPDPPPLQTCSP